MGSYFPDEAIMPSMKRCLLPVFIIVFVVGTIVFSNIPAKAGMKKKTVESAGSGATLNLAIYDALDEAIGRVNGKALETRKQLDSVEISMADSQKEDYFSSESFQSSIKSASKGVIDRYDILSKGVNKELGLWEVTLSVTVVKFVVTNSNRKRIAVMSVTPGGGRFSIAGKPVSKERVTRILTQNIVSTLVQTRRFIVLDREYMTETFGERNMALSPNSPVEEMARLGQELVADYIMVGVLEDVGFSEKVHRMKSSGREVTSRQGNVELSVRLIDVATRQVVFSDFLKMNVVEKDLKRFDSSLSDEGPEAAMAIVAADRAGRCILDVIYPIMIVSVSGDMVTLGQGGSQLKRNDRLEIFRLGKRLTDPYTKEFIGREEVNVGLLEVKRVNPKQSHARIIESSDGIFINFEPKKFICRAVQHAVDQEKIERKARRKARDEQRKKRDSDW